MQEHRCILRSLVTFIILSTLLHTGCTVTKRIPFERNLYQSRMIEGIVTKSGDVVPCQRYAVLRDTLLISSEGEIMSFPFESVDSVVVRKIEPIKTILLIGGITAVAFLIAEPWGPSIGGSWTLIIF